MNDEVFIAVLILIAVLTVIGSMLVYPYRRGVEHTQRDELTRPPNRLRGLLLGLGSVLLPFVACSTFLVGAFMVGEFVSLVFIAIAVGCLVLFVYGAGRLVIRERIPLGKITIGIIFVLCLCINLFEYYQYSIDDGHCMSLLWIFRGFVVTCCLAIIPLMITLFRFKNLGMYFRIMGFAPAVYCVFMFLFATCGQLLYRLLWS